MSATFIACFLGEWLAARYGVELAGGEVVDEGGGRFSTTFSANGRTIAVEGGLLFADHLTPAFTAHVRRTEDVLAAQVSGPASALWVPPGAELPAGEGALQALAGSIQELAARMAPGTVTDLALPVRLDLRKTAEDGAYIAATGALSDHWSQISQSVRGVYQLDSRAVHRLPRNPGFIDAIARDIAALSGRMTVGEWAELPSADHWTLQRLQGGEGFAVLAAPPAFDPADGTYVRRALRRLVRELGSKLTARAAALRVLLVVTALKSIRDENIGPALVSFDPTLFTAIDMLCLAADGELRAVLEPPAASTAWPDGPGTLTGTAG